jgi:DNA repair protein RecN (Recombination protein N)
MLRHIHIRHFAVVDTLELGLSPGMTVLTGETGAGKSILLDALGLALGDRGDSGIIRAGAERAEVSADFDIAGVPDVQQWLQAQDLDDDGQCLIRRTISRDGRSKGYINGRPVPMQSLRELGEMLVDIHGQHAHQSLLKRDMQRQVVDDFAGHQQLLDAVAAHYRRWRELRAALDQLTASRAAREDRLELLRYQVQELEALELRQDELEELDAEHDRLANLNQLREEGQQVLQALAEDDNGALIGGLEHAAAQLQRLRDFDAALANACEALQSAAIQAREAGGELRDYLEALSLDPQRLQEVSDRLAALHDLARKHHVTPEALVPLLAELQAELHGLETADVELDATAREVAATEAAYRAGAEKLTASRAKAAKRLAKAVSENMRQLGMKDGRFEVAFEPLEAFTAAGLERVEFQVTTNPGQPLQALAKVVSGGELSRISLAIQVIIAGTGRIPTLIFDEVDVGIGGGVAEIVGRLLRGLSTERQVLCVTHQPQVASLAHHHLQVSKQSHKKTTLTAVAPLSAEGRVDEIARMLGGVEITPQTLSHAREMIERGQQANAS